MVEVMRLMIQGKLRWAYYNHVPTEWYTWNTEWGYDAEAELRPDSVPEWALDRYSHCVYWEATFYDMTSERRRGPDLVKECQGIGWGWILFNNDGRFGFTEVGMEWDYYKDGELFESHKRTFIDAWDEASFVEETPPSDDA